MTMEGSGIQDRINFVAHLPHPGYIFLSEIITNTTNIPLPHLPEFDSLHAANHYMIYSGIDRAGPFRIRFVLSIDVDSSLAKEPRRCTDKSHLNGTLTPGSTTSAYLPQQRCYDVAKTRRGS